MALVGATASGKSSVALAVARACPDVELVSVDSMQVYRGMDIGTAKPTMAQRAEIVHHCLDLVEPTDEFTVAAFQRAASEATDAIAARRGRTLFVGGTGLYHRAVIDRFDLPGQYPAARQRLDAEIDLAADPDEALGSLYARLSRLDPAAAQRIEPGNRRRIVRALEVIEGAGRPFSSFGPGVDHYPTSDVVQIGVRRPREVTAERIADRVDAMLEAGWLDEVAALAPRGLSRTASQALGYRELLDHLGGRLTLAEAIDQTVRATRRFATRQERWFRRDPRVRWVDVEDDPVAELVPVVLDAFDR